MNASATVRIAANAVGTLRGPILDRTLGRGGRFGRLASHSARGAVLALAAAGPAVGCTRATARSGGTPAAAGPTTPLVAPYRRDPIGAADSLRAAALMATGVAYRSGRATLWVPRDSVAAAHARALADSLARAIPAIEQFVGLPAPWARHTRPPVAYFLVPGARFTPHGDAGARVFIPLQQVREPKAAYLHETAHVLALPRRKTPAEAADSTEGARLQSTAAFWLIEGVADYVGKTVAEQIGFAEGDGLTGRRAGWTPSAPPSAPIR